MSEMKDWNLNLTRFILNAIRSTGFISAIIEGERRLGKSAYAIKVMASVFYKIDGTTEQEAWDRALDNMIFSPEQLMKKIEQRTADEKIDYVWCIDDAAVHFSGYLYFINIYQTAYLQGMFDTIGTVTNALLLTCPKKRRLMSGLRYYDDYCIQIIKKDNWERIAKGIKWFTVPDGKQHFRKMFEDNYSCYLPKAVFDKYMIQRKMYLKEIGKKLREMKEDLERRKKQVPFEVQPEEVLEVENES